MAECKPRHVLRRDGNQVSLCECGTVSLSAGPVTVRLPRTEFDRLAALVHEAAAHFAADGASPAADPAGHLVH